MKEIISFECAVCGKIYRDEQGALECEFYHAQDNLANKLLEKGYRLDIINNSVRIFDELPKKLVTVNKDTKFKIPYLQCKEDFRYKIVEFNARAEKVLLATTKDRPYEEWMSLKELETHDFDAGIEF